MENQPNFTTKEMALLLNCSTDKLHQMMYKYGLLYLLYCLPYDYRARGILERSAVYWGWFKNQWYIHDQALLNDWEFFTYTIVERRRYYKILHEPQAMANDIKLNDVVLAEVRKKSLIPLKQAL
jgi:hypothetical protein